MDKITKNEIKKMVTDELKCDYGFIKTIMENGKIEELQEVMVDYRLRDELRLLTVCVYCPNNLPENQHQTMTLFDYLANSDYQIGTGELPQRYAYHVTASPADAERAILDMRRRLTAVRHEADVEKKAPAKKPERKPEKGEQRHSWGWSGGIRQ